MMNAIFVIVLLAAAHFCVSAVMMYGMSLAALAPLRRAAAAHWTERARLMWPVRRANGLLIFAIPASLCAAQTSLFPSLPFGYIYAGIAGLPGAILGMWPLARALFPGVSLKSWFADISTLFVIRFIALGAVVAAGCLMPRHWSLRSVELALAAAVFILWLNWGGVLWLLRISGGLAEASERIKNAVSDVAAAMELPLPRVWMLRGFRANAYALATQHAILVSETAANALSDEELGAVCAHEFAHLNQPQLVIVAQVLSSFVLLPGIFLRPAMFAWGWNGYIAVFGAIYLMAKLIAAWKRGHEKQADSVALAHEGPSAGAYARALERLYELNMSPAVIRGVTTHPNLYDRLVAAGATRRTRVLRHRRDSPGSFGSLFFFSRWRERDSLFVHRWIRSISGAPFTLINPDPNPDSLRHVSTPELSWKSNWQMSPRYSVANER